MANNAKLPDIETLLQAGINPKTGLPMKFGNRRCSTKEDIKKCIRKKMEKLSLAMLPLKPERIWSGVGWLRGTHGMTRKSTLSLKSCNEIFRSFLLRKCPIVQGF